VDDICIFCKIAKNEINSHTVYEDEQFKAILDVNPCNKGHVLVIPKTHIKDIYELDEQLGAELFKIVIKISKAVKKTYSLKGLNIVQNNGEVAGQTVMHFHMHIVPRNKEDKITLGWESISLVEEDFKKTLEDIKLNM
jgi:histidine triad (HIT) family protein